MNKTGLIAVLICTLFVQGAAAGREGFMIRSTRSIGMGGAGVALAGPYNAVFYNPALLSRTTRTHVRLLELQAVADENALLHYKFYENNQERLENIDQLTDAEKSSLFEDVLGVAREQTTLGFHGAAPLTIVRPGFSLGIYERALANYNIREGASSIPNLHADAIAEGEVVLGLGTDLGRFLGFDLGFGANLKYLYRAVSSETKAIPALETIEDIRVYHGSTFAVDFGLLISAGKWTLGAGFYDVNWPEISWSVNGARPAGLPAPDSTISASYRVGAACEPDFGLPGLLDQLKLAVDIDSPWTEDSSFLKKINMGAEVRLAGFTRLRGGFHQGYPTVGGAISLKILQIAYAYGGEELGRHPGQLPAWNHYVSIGIGWGF
jgi:hypothetical protein